MTSLMENLVENAKLMPKEGDDGSPTPCQLQCQHQQQLLVACVGVVRESGDKTCLSPAVHAWTKCCTEANMADSE